MDRLNDQIDWYSRKSATSQRYYKRIKLTEIIAAALIPFLAALHISDASPNRRVVVGVATALLGVLITILEGILQLNQYQQIWITYRATCEAMKHEKFTYLTSPKPERTRRRPILTHCWRRESRTWARRKTPSGLPCVNRSRGLRLARNATCV